MKEDLLQRDFTDIEIQFEETLDIYVQLRVLIYGRVFVSMSACLPLQWVDGFQTLPVST